MGHISPEVTGPISTAIIGFACMIIAVGSLTSLLSGRNTGRALATYIGVGLEFLLAAGLIRLASVDTYAMLGVSASILVVRRAIVLGLGYAVAATANARGA